MTARKLSELSKVQREGTRDWGNLTHEGLVMVHLLGSVMSLRVCTTVSSESGELYKEF